MRNLLFIILITFGLGAAAQTPLTYYQVPDIADMKAYYGSAKGIHVVATNEQYIICSPCTSDEITVYEGIAGRKWKRFVPIDTADMLANYYNDFYEVEDTVLVMVKGNGGQDTVVFSGTGVAGASGGSSGTDTSGGSFYVDLNYLSATSGAEVGALDTLTLADNFLDLFYAKIDTTTDNNLVVSGSTLNTNKAPITLTDAATIVWDVSLGYNAKVTLITLANRALSITNPQAGQYYKLTIIQDATGNRTITLPAGSLYPGGTVINLTTTPLAKDILMAFYDGTNYFWTISKDFK